MDPHDSLIRIPGDASSLAPWQTARSGLPPGGAAASRETVFSYFWRVLKARRWSIFAFCAIFFGLITYATLKMVPVYEATSTLAIFREGQNLLGFSHDKAASEEEFLVNFDTEYQIISGDSLALRVARKLSLDRNPAFTHQQFGAGSKPLSDNELQARILQEFRNNLSVTTIPHTRLLEIHYFSSDPQLAARVVNALGADYINQNFAAKFDSTMDRSNWLTRELSSLQATVRTSEEKLVRFQRENGILVTADGENIATTKLMKLDQDATAAQVDAIRKRADYEMARQGDPALIIQLDRLGRMGELRQRESELAGERAKLGVQLGPSSARMLEIASQKQQVRNDIQAERTRLTRRLKVEYVAAKERQDMLRSALEQQKQEALRMDERSIQYSKLKRETETNRKIFDALLERLKEAGISAGMRSNNVRVIEPARVPDRPARPNIALNLLLGFATGLGGAVALAFLFENMDSTLRSMHQVESVSAFPVLAVIPFSAALRGAQAKNTPQAGRELDVPMATAPGPLMQPPGQRGELALLANPKSELAEAYRALRTSILLSTPGSPPQIIMVTSALPQEGKTTTCVNTAIMLAQQGSRVLLVDGDLRRPSIHEYFHLQNHRGLSNFLAGEDIEPDPMAAAGIDGLFVLPAGPVPPHPAELLASKAMRTQLLRWRLEYDHIVIDTPPVLSVTDAVLLSVEADAVVLVTRAASTTRDALRQCRDLLLQVNARLLGVIVNAVDPRASDSYSYYYGSKNGRGYYEEIPQTS